MSGDDRRSVSAIIMPAIAGVLFFGVLMGLSLGLVMINARLSPQIPWFPLPVVLLLWAGALWAERRWRIGLTDKPTMGAGRMIVLTVAITVLGVAACLLQGAWHGFVRQAESVPDGVPGLFAFVYTLVMSGVAAILAELSFRGIMQSRWHRLFAPWTVIVLVAVINLAAHRWGAWMLHQWLGYLIALGGLTWLRWQTGSLWPPLLGHLAANLLLALAHARYGDFDHGNIPVAVLWFTGAAAVICIGVAALLAQRPGARMASVVAR